MNKINPLSVVDVGCGLAQWLKVFENHGVKEVLGIDGDHVSLDDIYIDKSDFLISNLESAKMFSTNRVFDLAISLEVAEHISENGADGFIKMLTKLSNRILFSAAIPNQTGENHINEQPHIYWKNKFQEMGYEMLDIIRPLIWDNPKINWWYRQNMFLLVKKEDVLYDENLKYNDRQIIHPELLNMYVGLLSQCENKLKKKQHPVNYLIKKILK
jgi:hypothetical protein